ncbi:hypothetical protein B0H17DRAFT_1203792 [Mycena rosella]|uniref:Uncharacterized protein n=1 Tax=Mycena rosella TaxID=1033263 RepID=A0AAD7DAU3_MYCRO|nr:hypothetical protein B0H17DRAFT_1203792 [Mycena rosella]
MSRALKFIPLKAFFTRIYQFSRATFWSIAPTTRCRGLAVTEINLICLIIFVAAMHWHLL